VAAILADMQLAFLGFGLIGGSIARAVRANKDTSDWRMSAWSPSGNGPKKAAADGVIDVAGAKAESVLRDADLIILAGPATASLPLIDRLAGRWRNVIRPDAIVTDVASTKAAIVERADSTGLWFVGGHPMAGLESAGYEASDGDLFVDRPWVVVPGALAGVSDIERVTDLAEACRAVVVRMDAATHDRAVAAISHLPLIVSAALVEAIAIRPGTAASRAAARAQWPVASGLAAGGWRDMTRLALGDPAMGAAIAVTNASEIAARLRDLRAVLDAWQAELDRPDGPDEKGAASRLAAAKAILEKSR
jgi:prephenate dehydrogenase